MKFDTWYDRKKDHRIISEPGSGMKATYKMTVDKDGRRELRKSGEYNLYAEIQSYKDSCSIDYILSRFAAGDSTALSRVQGIYGDFSQVPTTMAEVMQHVIDAEHYFNALPLDVREQFNFSPSEFFAQFGTEKVDRIINPEKYAEVDVVDKISPDIKLPFEPTVPESVQSFANAKESVGLKGDVTNEK